MKKETLVVQLRKLEVVSSSRIEPGKAVACFNDVPGKSTPSSAGNLFLLRGLETIFLNTLEVFLPISFKYNKFKSLEIVTERGSKILDNSL